MFLSDVQNIDLDFLPLFPCHQEQQPIVPAVIGCCNGTGGLACSGVRRVVSLWSAL